MPVHIQGPARPARNHPGLISSLDAARNAPTLSRLLVMADSGAGTPKQAVTPRPPPLMIAQRTPRFVRLVRLVLLPLRVHRPPRLRSPLHDLTCMHWGRRRVVLALAYAQPPRAVHVLRVCGPLALFPLELATVASSRRSAQSQGTL
ncbi:hypothetical protein FOMPIDRAFT_1023123 [Fomitopsis schrenkii]|uniref:Uncharacterized protein n=1 Tax=Fomitopsis schrenkii TaxID=2126942 RepID=S8FUJ9_FOMSC|nr:hypothetical protein FOMPIDRAFT_1023123 [Fomitopsis schrenkii]